MTPRVLNNYRKVQLDAQENSMQDVIDDTRTSIEDFVRSLLNERSRSENGLLARRRHNQRSFALDPALS